MRTIPRETRAEDHRVSRATAARCQSLRCVALRSSRGSPGKAPGRRASSLDKAKSPRYRHAFPLAEADPPFRTRRQAALAEDSDGPNKQDLYGIDPGVDPDPHAGP